MFNFLKKIICGEKNITSIYKHSDICKTVVDIFNKDDKTKTNKNYFFNLNFYDRNLKNDFNFEKKDKIKILNLLKKKYSLNYFYYNLDKVIIIRDICDTICKELQKLNKCKL